jgi:hypothetical protein
LDDGLVEAIKKDFRQAPISEQDHVMLEFVEKVTKDATRIGRDDHERLRAVGFDDTGILQVTLIASWFNYINRVADALAWDGTHKARASKAHRPFLGHRDGRGRHDRCRDLPDPGGDGPAGGLAGVLLVVWVFLGAMAWRARFVSATWPRVFPERRRVRVPARGVRPRVAFLYGWNACSSWTRD